MYLKISYHTMRSESSSHRVAAGSFRVQRVLEKKYVKHSNEHIFTTTFTIYSMPRQVLSKARAQKGTW
jgi:hypothetical protein